MAYQNVTLYFMSGTGNSFRVATWLAEAATAQGVAARVVPIAEARPDEEVRPGPGQLLGLVFPTHGFTAPWAMLHFCLRLPRRGGTHALVMPTRAGSRMGKWYLPGLEGTAAYLLALVLLLKGYNVRGVGAVDMPSNWTALHPALSPQSVAGITARTKARVEQRAATVLSGQRYLAGQIPLFLGLLLLPVSLAYLLVGRFFLAKLFFANSNCNGCRLCVDNCPHHALRMWGKKKPRPYWTYSCESCLRCMGYCPRKAVEAGHSWGVILYFVMAVPVLDLSLRRLAGAAPWLERAAASPAWRWVLQYPYKLLSLFAAYALFSLLIRVPLVNKLFTWTTLTHLYRRYHEPETSLGEMKRSGK